MKVRQELAPKLDPEAGGLEGFPFPEVLFYTPCSQSDLCFQFTLMSTI